MRLIDGSKMTILKGLLAYVGASQAKRENLDSLDAIETWTMLKREEGMIELIAFLVDDDIDKIKSIMDELRRDNEGR